MNSLIRSEDLHRIESQLLLRRDQLVHATAWTFNAVALLVILGTFVYFLYVQYTSNQVTQEEEKRIPFEPQVWYSASRNVRGEEYGRQLQPFELEARYGVPEPLDRGSAEALL
jgi:hypothetical protein